MDEKMLGLAMTICEGNLKRNQESKHASGGRRLARQKLSSSVSESQALNASALRGLNPKTRKTSTKMSGGGGGGGGGDTMQARRAGGAGGGGGGAA